MENNTGMIRDCKTKFFVALIRGFRRSPKPQKDFHVYLDIFIRRPTFNNMEDSSGMKNYGDD